MTGRPKINNILFFRSLVLLVYSLFFLYIILNGSIVKYVHPRYNIFIVISCVIAGFVIIVMLLSLRSHSHGKLSAPGIVMLVIPLLLVYLTRNMDKNYSDQFSKADNTGRSSFGKQESSSEVPDLFKNARKSSLIELDSKHFVLLVDDIYNNPGEYRGKHVTVTGIAFKRKHAGNKKEFVIARKMMICCAADVQAVGFICSYNKASSLYNGKWYSVDGEFRIKIIDNSEIPVIYVSEAIEVDKPADEYVYPF